MVGLAILGNDGHLDVARWSAIPAWTSSNADGLPDAWKWTHFGTLAVDPAADPDADGIGNAFEYLFGTSPAQPSANPLRVSVGRVEDQRVLRLVFPRRAGLSPRPYEYQVSSDLTHWSPAADVSETVLSTSVTDSSLVETVAALVPVTNANAGFLRLHWLGR